MRRAILTGWLTAGILDITAASIWSGIYGRSPMRMLQGIAFGAFGPESLQMGWKSAAFGLFTHFLIALTATTLFVFASKALPWLAQHPFISGPLYGIVVYYFMQFVVIPLSRIPARPTPAKSLVIGLVIHMVCVGLPIALAASRNRDA